MSTRLLPYGTIKMIANKPDGRVSIPIYLFLPHTIRHVLCSKAAVTID